MRLNWDESRNATNTSFCMVCGGGTSGLAGQLVGQNVPNVFGVFGPNPRITHCRAPIPWTCTRSCIQIGNWSPLL